jgi:hypothetical protein
MKDSIAQVKPDNVAAAPHTQGASCLLAKPLTRTAPSRDGEVIGGNELEGQI